MPLRDHFRPPVSKKASWEGFHGMWPANIVQQLRKELPPGYVAEPRVHLGTLMEIDVGALESHEVPRTEAANGNGNAVAAAWTATAPVVAVETDPPDEYEYEVRIFDVERERTLVAAIELVSPANKDRPESRQAFVAKCAALLQERVSVVIIDLVTVRGPNLYGELLDMIGAADPALEAAPPLYAVACRTREKDKSWLLETWFHALPLGQPLPTLPLWLSEDLAVPLELEASYQATCRMLRIG